MRTKLVEANRPEKYIHAVKNVDTNAGAAPIPLGTPLVLNLSGTAQPTTSSDGHGAGYEDGLQVVLPSTGGAAASALYYYGVATSPIQLNQLGESQIHGLVQYALIAYASRAGTTGTNSWSASASIAASVGLVIDTVNNAFSTVASSAGGINVAILVDSVASFAASATTTADARTVLTALKRVFVRQM